MTPPEPPDWALPSWDSVPSEPGLTPVGRVPSSAEPRAASPAPVASGTFGVKILGVSEVTRAIRGAVRSDPRLSDLWVEGEIGRVTISSAGHAYFALKDERNQLQCVWFRDDRVRSAFEAQAGLRIVAHGRMDVFEPQGALQLYVESIQPSGFGDLTIRFEALKAKLTAEGLFASERKRRLPHRPRTVAVVTSPSGAVWKDICQVLARRWPLTRVVLVAAQVQGEAAPASLVAALRKVERFAAAERATGRADDAPALTILARGGGSLEDLWAFNDEAVVRAVVGHALPVVCGVGHETDVTLADFAADLRAPTPSAAAELVVPDRMEVLATVRTVARRMDASSVRLIAGAAREVTAERRALARVSPAAQLVMARERAGLLLDRGTRALRAHLSGEAQKLERLGLRLAPTLPSRLVRERVRVARGAALDPTVAGRVSHARASLGQASAALGVLGPQATLDRGYAIVRRATDQAIVRDPVEATPGTKLTLRVARGELPASADPR